LLTLSDVFKSTRFLSIKKKTKIILYFNFIVYFRFVKILFVFLKKIFFVDTACSGSRGGLKNGLAVTARRIFAVCFLQIRIRKRKNNLIKRKQSIELIGRFPPAR